MAEQLEFYFPKTKSKHMAMPTTGKVYPSKGGTVRYGVQASMNGSMSLPKYVKENQFYDYGFGVDSVVRKYPKEFMDAFYDFDSNPTADTQDDETVELAYQVWYQQQAENEVLNAEVNVGEKQVKSRKDYDIDNELSGFSNMEVGDIDLEDYQDEITESVEDEVIEAIRESVDDNMPISDGDSVGSYVNVDTELEITVPISGDIDYDWTANEIHEEEVDDEEWNAETLDFHGENYQNHLKVVKKAPYGGIGSLFGIGGDTELGGFSTGELTGSSAIHGDFDSASLNYSGHQNLQVRAEDSPSPSSPLEEVPATVPSPAEPTNESFNAEEEKFVDCDYCGRNIDLYDETNDSISCDECGKVACGSYKCNYSKNPKETWEEFTCGECVKGFGAEEYFDCGCPAEFVEYKDFSQWEYDGVQCNSCGYNSCLDCHHIDSTSANINDWKCYEGYGCNKGDESFNAEIGGEVGLEQLKSPEVKSIINKHGIKIVNREMIERVAWGRTNDDDIDYVTFSGSRKGLEQLADVIFDGDLKDTIRNAEMDELDDSSSIIRNQVGDMVGMVELDKNDEDIEKVDIDIIDEDGEMAYEGTLGAETFEAERIHGDERLDRWVENNYGEEYDWELLDENAVYGDVYEELEDFIVLDDEGNEHKGIAIVYRNAETQEHWDAETFGEIKDGKIVLWNRIDGDWYGDYEEQYYTDENGNRMEVRFYFDLSQFRDNKVGDNPMWDGGLLYDFNFSPTKPEGYVYWVNEKTNEILAKATFTHMEKSIVEKAAETFESQGKNTKMILGITALAVGLGLWKGKEIMSLSDKITESIKNMKK